MSPRGGAARVRRADGRDAAAILALEAHFPGDRLRAASVRHLLRTPSAAVWVAVRRGEILGALILLTRRRSRFARIYSLVVSPQARGEGLGARLVTAAERHARQHGCAAMSLEVRADNAAARTLYARLGYDEHAELDDYYDDGAPGLRLRRALR